jgi:hypothetical protein
MRMIDMAMSHGPSLAHGRKPFEKYFGREELLIQVVDYAHEMFQKREWGELAMPYSVGEKIRDYHLELQRKDRK